MIDSWIRNRLPRYTSGLLQAYKAIGLSANGVTCLGFLFACLAAWAVSLGHFYIAVCLWWLGRLADGTDGIYARANGTESAFGAYWDIVLDMAAYGLMIIAFDFYFPQYGITWSVILFLYILCIASALALGIGESEAGLSKTDNRGLRLGAGVAEAGETGIAYTLFLLFPGWIEYTSVVWALILTVTVVLRTLLAYKTLSTT